MIYSKFPREAYTWTHPGTKTVYGIGKLLKFSTDTAWNTTCLVLDIEQYANQKSVMDFDTDLVGQAMATDRVMDRAGKLPYWMGLSTFTPLAFMYRVVETEASYIFSQEVLDAAFAKAEILEPYYQPMIEGNVIYPKFWGR